MKKIFTLFLLSILAFHVALSRTLKPNTWGFDGTVSAIVADNSYTYFGGKFHYYGPPTGAIAKITTHSNFPDMHYPVINGTVYTIAPDGKGGWYIGGKFTIEGSQQQENLAHILGNGTISSWDPTTDDIINKIVVDDSAVYIGGYFQHVNGHKIKFLAKINRLTGKLYTGWDPAPDETVLDIALRDSALYIAGRFKDIDNQPQRYIAKIKKKSGSLIKKWSPLPNNVVHTIALSGHNVYFGGEFTSIWSGGGGLLCCQS